MKKKFTGNTRVFLCISAAIIVVALIMQIVGVGLNLGIDFTGGSILEYSVGEEYDQADVEKILVAAGYDEAQVLKVEPGEASQLQQQQLAAEEAEAAEEAAAEEAEATEEETVEAADEETVEETVEAAHILDMDKSGIKADGKTDLQVRLNLIDEAANMESAVEAAVEGGKLTKYEQLTYLSVTTNGYDADFAGGYVLEFDMGGAFEVAGIEEKVTALLNEGYALKNVSFEAYAPEEGAEATALRILVDLDDTTSKVRSTLEKEMSAKYPHFHFISIDHVSGVAGRDLIANAVKALLLAFVCMLIYIALRFDPLSGLAALAALLHDVLIMCAFMVFFRAFFQVNSPFIAAVLTIVGYSINNTIIIFDRIRENAKKPGMTQMNKMDIVETSVATTFSRTVNTTLTTLITLVCLYIFGVESIREFAFPLLIGMFAGTYSSVLLSGQVWAMWSEKFEAKKAAAKKA